MDGGGSLEVFSDQPVLVSSRTYSTSDAGTYGQFLDGNLSVTSDELAAQWRDEFHGQSENEKKLELSVWSDFRTSLRENYVRFIEENVHSE